MTNILTLITDEPVAAAFGGAGLAGQLAWPLLRSRTRILAAQLGIASSYATQYALLGQWTGTGVCAVGATQTVFALVVGNRPWLRYLGLCFIPIVGLISYLTWSGAASAFAMTACCMIMIARLQRDTLRMRAIMLAAAPFGIGYDLAVGAIPALAGAILSAAIGIGAFRREWVARMGSSTPRAQAA